MENEILKIIYQLIIIGIIGGGVTFYYNKLQKNRELVISIINQASTIHTEFISLRYKFNVLFTHSGKPIRNILTDAEVDKLKWRYYEESCLLLSRFQSLQPLLLKFAPILKDDIGKMEGFYQNYRRLIRANQPIFQNEAGKTQDRFNDLKYLHRDLINELTKKI